MAATAPTRRRRRLRTVVARTLLVLTLVPQLGILWVLHRPSPTTIPAGLAAALAEEALPDSEIRIERATVDRRGIVRIEGARLWHPVRDSRVAAGGALEGWFDATITPPWREWILLGSAPARVRAQGRVTRGWPGVSTGSAVLDRVDLRSGAGGEIVAVASAGNFHLRAVVKPGSTGAEPVPPEGEGEPGDDLNERGRRLEPVTRLLLALREFTGGAEVIVDGNSWRAAASGRRRGEAGPLKPPVEIADFVGGGQLPFDVGGFSARATGDGEGASVRLDLVQLRLGEVRLGSAELEIRQDGGFRLAATDLDFAGATGGTVDLEGRGQPGRRNGAWAAEGRGSASLGESRLSGRFAARAGGELQVTELNLATSARDATRWPGVGAALREVGADFGGRLELADGRVLASGGKLLGASGRFALAGAGWGDLRSSSIRPERPDAAVSGAFNLNLQPGEIRLTDLDIAGLRGSISGGLDKGDPYEVRLASTPGNPVHPGCLNSLLGDWWRELWRRFDLSTGGAAPHAAVVVRGRWGASAAERVEVAASLGNFGFMGGRFADARVRVEATPEETLVWIDELAGQLDGKPAGSARGRLRWDWRNEAWAGRPEILAEGDLEPALALRLHDPAQAQRIRGWSLGLPWTKIRITPGEATEVALATGSASRVEGVELGPMQLAVSLPAEPGRPPRIRLGAAFAGGRLEADLEGDLREDCLARRLALTDVGWPELQKALPHLLGKPPEGAREEPAILSADFAGKINLTDPAKAEGKGGVRLRDPRLKTVHLFGGLSQSLSAVGIDFATYPLTEARATYALTGGRAQLTPLDLEGPDALLRLNGSVDLKTGGINLKGDFRIKKSTWGVLGIINPNRLITNILGIRVEGTLEKPRTRVEAPGF